MLIDKGSIRGPWGSPGVPGASLGGLRDVPGRPGGVPGRPRGVPVGSRRVPSGPRGVLGVPGACPGDPWHPRGLRGRPRHPRDSFHKDGSVI